MPELLDVGIVQSVFALLSRGCLRPETLRELFCGTADSPVDRSRAAAEFCYLPILTRPGSRELEADIT